MTLINRYLFRIEIIRFLSNKIKQKMTKTSHFELKVGSYTDGNRCTLMIKKKRIRFQNGSQLNVIVLDDLYLFCDVFWYNLILTKMSVCLYSHE